MARFQKGFDRTQCYLQKLVSKLFFSHGVKIQENASHYPKELSLEVSHILNNLFQAYDTRLRPNFGGPPVLVNVTVLLENLGPISEVAMVGKK